MQLYSENELINAAKEMGKSLERTTILFVIQNYINDAESINRSEEWVNGAKAVLERVKKFA